MSLTFINNQPVKFIASGSNPNDEPGRGEYDYMIPVDFDESDITKVQLKVAPMAGTEDAIDDPSFTLASSGFDWAASGSGILAVGLATIGDGSTGEVYISTENRTINGRIYQLRVNVQSIFGTAYVYLDNTQIAEINATGEQTISFEGDGGDSIRILITDDTSYIEVTNVSVKALPQNYAMAVLDTSYVPVEIITYLSNPEYFVFAKDTVTIAINWDVLNIPKGCYYLGITDPETNTCAQLGLYNYSFDIGNTDEDGAQNIPGWDGSSANVSFEPGICEITAATGTDVSIESNRYQLCGDISYDVSIVARKSGANNCSMVLTCGGDSETWSVTSTTSATFTGTIVLVGNDYVTITNDNTPGSGSDNVLIIESITITPTNIEDWDFEYVTPYSYKLASYDAGDLKKIGLFNNEDGLGFAFKGTEFYPYIRAEAKFINRSYNYERNTNETDDGTKSVMFGQMRGARIFRIESHPNYLIDFFALIPIADHFFIDDTEWFVESDTYSPAYDETLDNFARSEFIVSEPTQLVRNINSGNTLYPPSPDGEMTDMDRIAILTEPRTGDTVESR